MLETLSIHYETVTTSLGRYLPTYGHSHLMTALNLGLLERVLEEECPQDAISAGKKRSKNTGSPERAKKRTKLPDGSHTPSQASPYPAVPEPKAFRLDEVDESHMQETAAVLEHVLDVRYGGLTPDKHPKLLELLGKFDAPTTLSLGAVELGELDGRVVATGEDWLMVVPQVHDGVDAEDDDYTTLSVDLISACTTLVRAGKATVGASASLLVEDASSFHIQLTLLVSLCLPHIFRRLSQKESRRHFDLVEQAQRRLLSHVYAPKPSEANHDVNIAYFYSILQPAPGLLPVVDDAMQPDLLNPTLLPFQRRSVGWLLHREGMDITRRGEIEPNPYLGEFTFWIPVSGGDHSWHYNPLNGVLSAQPPGEPPVALGGILAEEPGLGKTLEMISLILLHPPDESRNPTVTRWDPESRLNVKAVKTSLIVTPPALASQWVDEIAAHAPTLKVLVYDGWSKVKVPITRTKLEEERAKRAVKEAEEEKKQVALEKAKAGKLKRKSRARQSKAKAKEPQLPVDAGPDLTKDAEGNMLEWSDFVQQYDVVITTYQVLRSDFNVARAPPVRPRREDVKYVNIERPRSPLVMVEWNRVIMDEVQMVGGAKLEDMVSLIPRLSSYAVSGTPARAQVADLIHVVKFLRVFGVVGSEKLWKRLIKPGFAHLFAQFIRNYTIRTTKASVKLELTIPQQTRYLVPISLGRVEQHVYDQTLEAILLDLGLDARGVAASQGWEVDAAVLRTSIRRLRGICTHPQVGQLQKKGDAIKRGALKSMEEVLENMRDMNWKSIMEDWKAKIQLTVRYGQLVQQNGRNARARDIALETFQGAEKDIGAHMKEIETLLTEHRAKGEVLKQEAAAARRAQAEAKAVQFAYGSEPGLNIPEPSNSKGKGKARAVDDFDVEDDDSDDEDEENVEDRGLPKTPAGKEHRAKTQALKSRLREGKLILHKIKFLMGDLFHNLGRSKDEDEAYEHAERLRKDLLQGSEDDASRAMAQLDEDLTKKRFNAKELEIRLPYLGKGGIRSADLMEEANELIQNVLNEQSKLLVEWRVKIVQLLTQKLTGKESDADEGDGQEYQRNLDNQGEAEVYMQAYAALLADRREALVNERTLLAAHDVREKKLRHTKAAMKAAQALEEGGMMMAVDDVELQPEHEVMYKGLSDQRKDLLQQLYGRAIKSVMVDLNAILQRLTQNKDEIEREIVTKAVADIRRLMSTQSQLHDKLDADLVLIRKAFNERILYFRQLQEISDSVADVNWEHPTLNDAIEDCLAERVELEGKINTNRARHRYLVNLVNNKGVPVDEDEDEENVCILCRCDFLRGFITQCAHIFCEGCMKAWLQRREGKTCPVCRVAIDPDTVQRFTVNAAEAEAPKQPLDGQAAPQSTRRIEYNFIDPEVFNRIEKMESLGDFGSKIQTLVRHLLHLQTEDPGAKSIVFSAWADSLHIVEWALHSNGIRCLRIDQKSKGESAAKKFRTDPDILVLLLHGERENAGLNVTCASRVFLLESVVHHSFEIQAIARIDRMGQTRPTEVYCYYAEDTVERSILDLAARKGLSLYTKDKAAGTLDTTSFSQENDQNAIDAPTKKKTQKGDFIFKIDDMLAVLFPHMYEDVEYLIPEEELAGSEDVEMADGTSSSSSAVASSRPPARVRSNAVAGPSRMAR